MKKILSFLLIIALSVSLCSCAASGKQRYSETLLDYFDTVTSIVAYDNSEADFKKHLSEFEARLKKYNCLYDIYNSYDGVTNIKDINDKAALTPVKADKRIIALLKYGKDFYENGNGKTNICLGAVLRLWHNARESETPYLPEMSDLREAAKHTDINDLIIDEEKSTVYFKDGDMKLDVGAIAKGFAARELCEWAKNNLWSAAAISIGGNVCTFGTKADDGKTMWNVEIENPDMLSSAAPTTLNLTDLSVVTSGDYQRYMEVDGKRYCHIIDPKTLMPAEYVSAVTVVCADSALADALSTTLFNMSVEDGQKLIADMEGVEALWVDKEYNEYYSAGFEGYIKR